MAYKLPYKKNNIRSKGIQYLALKKISFFVLFIIFLITDQKALSQFEFVENKGQWPLECKFKTDASNSSMILNEKGYTILQWDNTDWEQMQSWYHGDVKDTVTIKKYQSQTQIVKGNVTKVNFEGANIPKIISLKKEPTYNNYFIGNDPSKWASNCGIFKTILYENIYDNIDLRYYTDGGKLKYDWIVKPGGDYKKIVLLYEGVNNIQIKNGRLKVKNNIGEIEEYKPFTYQLKDGLRKEIVCNFKVKKNKVRFELADYNPKEALVIDPTLIFCSFTGSGSDNWGYTATYGPDGSFFAGGIVFGNLFPTSAGAIQTTFAGGEDASSSDGLGPHDIAIMKLSSNGTQRLYSTYIGGSESEQPHSMISNGAGELYVTGRTNSPNFPGTGTNIGPLGGTDMVIFRINATGTAVLRSVKIGGSGLDGVNISRSKLNAASDATKQNYGDDARGEINFDQQGNIILVGNTQSSNFPVLNAIQPSFGGGRQDAIVLKLSSDLNTLLFSSYFGGSGDDAGFVIEASKTDNSIYVAGGSTSNNLRTSVGVYQTNYQGGTTDGYILHLNATGTYLQSSYLGTGNTDMIYGVKCDKFGFPYVMGTSKGSWPVVNASYSNTGAKQFIMKINKDLSSNIYSTVFGSNSANGPNISPTAFLVDRCENVYVSGWGGRTNINFQGTNTNNMPLVSALPNVPAGDGSDFYFFVMERNAQSQLFGSYFGENNPSATGTGDHVDGGTSRFDPFGVIYQAVCANCGKPAFVTFPTTAGAYATTNGSNRCNEAMIKVEMNFGGVGSIIQSSIANQTSDTVGCVPLTVIFRDSIKNGVTYYWNFGDGSPEIITTNPTRSHTFNNIGIYNVRLISEDLNTCNQRDTSYIRIKVGDNEIVPRLSYKKVGACTELNYEFSNLSTAVIENPYFNNPIFIWDMGDNSPLVARAKNQVFTHTFPAPGIYRVKIQITDTNFCNAPITLDTVLRINSLVKAAISTAPKGCVAYNAVFTNNSTAGTEFEWDFGDPASGVNNISVIANPTHLYNTIGSYTIRLIAKDTNTCNKVDTAYFKLDVLPKPIASFTYSPNPAIANTPFVFNNTSQFASTYKWDFGDGESSTLVNPKHLFIASLNYKVTLYAYNEVGCYDSTIQIIKALINPLADVPNAFTPNRFDINGILKVAGFGISKMKFRIYNRWEQVVYETSNRNEGWDGTYKGKDLPMDVYTYTLDITFSDGKTLKQKGDITLIR